MTSEPRTTRIKTDNQIEGLIKEIGIGINPNLGRPRIVEIRMERRLEILEKQTETTNMGTRTMSSSSRFMMGGVRRLTPSKKLRSQ